MRALPYVVPVALAIYALIDLSRSTPVERGGLRRLAWVAIIVLLPVLGPVGWILISRSRRDGEQRPPRAGGGSPGRGRPAQRRRGPVAPDDDPDFLWRLEQQQRRSRPPSEPPVADQGPGADPDGATDGPASSDAEDGDSPRT